MQFLDSHVDLEAERSGASGFYARFRTGSIPAIGFIGAAWGIGLALMGAGSALADVLAKH